MASEASPRLQGLRKHWILIGRQATANSSSHFYWFSDCYFDRPAAHTHFEVHAVQDTVTSPLQVLTGQVHFLRSDISSSEHFDFGKLKNSTGNHVLDIHLPQSEVLQDNHF